MRGRIRIGSLILFILISVFLVVLLCGYRMFTRSLPPAKGSLRVAGLESEVRMFRDGYGIPHLFAKNERDLFFAQGFVTAQNRLWQMDFLRHTAQGKLSEWFGKESVNTDSLLRLSGIRETSERMERNLSDDSRRMLESYSRGVNAFIQMNQNHLPIEFALIRHIPESWKPGDCIILFRLMVWQSNLRWLEEPFLSELLGSIDSPRLSDILLMDGKSGKHPLNNAADLNRFLRNVLREELLPPPASGTMSWAIGSNRSITGKPLLSIITRNALTNPSPWYEILLTAGACQVSGLSLPGFPMVLLGQNETVAWGWTDMRNKISDLQHWNIYAGFAKEGQVPSLCDEPLSVYQLNRSKDWPSFQKALKTIVCPEKYFAYADTFGNIGYQQSGPDAAAGSFNPQDGIAWMDDRSAVFLPPLQHGRIQKLLSQKNRMSLEELKQIQTDVVSDFAPRFLERIKPVLLKDTLSSPFEKQVLESVTRWDGSFKPGCGEAACFEAFIQHCLGNIYKDEMGDSLFASFQYLSWLHPDFLLRTVANLRSPWFDDVRSANRVETAEEILSKSFKDAVSQLSEKWGEDFSKWSWAGFHTLSFNHPLGKNPLMGKVFNLGPFAVGGSADAVLSMDHNTHVPFEAVSGPSARLLVDLANPDYSVSVLPPGQSGQPMDPHYQDQVQFYLQNYYHPVLWDSSKITRSGWDLTVFKPEAAIAK